MLIVLGLGGRPRGPRGPAKPLPPDVVAALAGVEIVALLQGPTRRGGNLLVEVGPGPKTRLLKIYRPRRSPLREASQGISHRVFEGKRGVTPEARVETEREALALWRAAGAEVPAVLDDPLPPGLHDPALWLERLHGETLVRVLARADLAWEPRRTLLRRLGEAVGRRFREAEARRDPLLVHEHGTPAHVLVCPPPPPPPSTSGPATAAPTSFDPDTVRLAFFDLEHGFRRGFPVATACAQELGGLLRGIAKAVPEDRLDDAMTAFATGYDDRPGLTALARRAARGGSPALGWLRRLVDRWRRPVHAKSSLAERLCLLLGDGEANRAVRPPPSGSRPGA